MLNALTWHRVPIDRWRVAGDTQAQAQGGRSGGGRMARGNDASAGAVSVTAGLTGADGCRLQARLGGTGGQAHAVGTGRYRRVCGGRTRRGWRANGPTGRRMGRQADGRARSQASGELSSAQAAAGRTARCRTRRRQPGERRAASWRARKRQPGERVPATAGQSVGRAGQRPDGKTAGGHVL